MGGELGVLLSCPSDSVHESCLIKLLRASGVFFIAALEFPLRFWAPAVLSVFLSDQPLCPRCSLAAQHDEGESP